MNGWHFFNRDISWLYFNERVLMEAVDETVPLMERFRFLSIFSSNLDEFYRVRMPAIMAVEKLGATINGQGIYIQALEIINRQQQLYGHILNEKLIPELRKLNYFFLNREDIPASIAPAARDYFFTHIAGLLQPVFVDRNAGFFPENNQLYIAAVVQHDNGYEKLFIVNIPSDILPRFYKIDTKEGSYILFIDDIIRDNLHYLFEGTVREVYNIKITRDAELELTDEYGEDLAEKMEKQLRKREMGFATRLLYEPNIPLRHLHGIIHMFNLKRASVIEGGKHHNLKDLASLPVTGPGLSYPAWQPVKRVTYADETLFEKIALKDHVIHPPYESYDNILRFFNEAAIDASVEEVYTTLYRVAGDSRIAQALISAAKNGKRVAVLVELKARFDEANNIRWAKRMREAGVRIIYSDNKLKVHAKVALVKRKYPADSYLGLLATGNLNESTARFYTDHILLTAHQPMLAELSLLFSFLGKRKRPAKEDAIDFKHLLVAQFNLQTAFLNLLQREIDHANNGLPASVIIKLNNLEEEVLIGKLYEASNAGVKVQLVVRSICRLVPGLPGQSENITVKRIVDRYLEHGRVFVFHNNGQPEVFMGSADWMNRNVYRRIEVCFPIYDSAIKQELLSMINIQLSDNVKARWIDSESYNAPVAATGAAIRSQEAIYKLLNA
jgi:polyphosphate kinase